MKKVSSLYLILGVVLSGCTNLDDAELTKRSTFIRFYEGANSIEAAEAREALDGGYIIAGTIRLTGEAPEDRMIVIKTDNYGQKEWETIIPMAAASSLLIGANNYYVVGDSVVYSPNTDVLANLENTSARIVSLDPGGNVIADVSYAETVQTSHVDHEGVGITRGAGNTLITLSTSQRPGQPQYAVIAALDETSLDTVWRQNFDYQNRDYVNTRSLYYSNGRILWGSSITENVSSFSRSYLAIPLIQENSTFVNSNYFGRNFSQEQLLRIRDLKPSLQGYAAIGTFSGTDGSKSNIFFIKVDFNGSFKEESVLYFDHGVAPGAIADPATSLTQDTGDALTMTSDGGYVLAGTTRDISGASNIWLMRLDFNGAVVWSKQIGGRTSEHVSSIVETDDGGLLISGTLSDSNNGSGGLSSMFLIKTDANGELRN